MKPYRHQEIEKKWQERWEEQRVFATPELGEKESGTYILNMFPYPSGSGLHVGHLLGYTGTDVTARVARMQGKKVLHPMGWDSFGLPAENYALKTGIHPADSTRENIAEYKRQFRQAGISYDWEREVATSDPEYYRWTQWLFQLLYRRGLAYRKEGTVNWCPQDQTVLANEQVVGGVCERCGTVVEQRQLKQWYFKITDYADRLLSGLDDLDWPERIKAMQRNWIGRSEGAYISFSLQNSEGTLEVFTTRPDTLFGVTYLVLAPDHPVVEALTAPAQKAALTQYQEQTKRKNELERLHLDKEKTGVWTGTYAIHPLTGERLPVWISDYVLLSYGTGAVMAVPAHDDRDAEFAAAHGLPSKLVIEPVTGTVRENEEQRRSIVAIVEDPKTGHILTLDWGPKLGGTLYIGGGREGNEDPVATAKREIVEETGYTDVVFVAKTEPIHHHYHAYAKGINREVEAIGLHFQLQSHAQDTTAREENERFTVGWLTKEQVAGRVTEPLHAYVFQKLILGKVYTGHGILTNSGEFSGLPSEEAATRIVAVLQAKGVGKAAVTYRLRDWLVSRQRYWGVPIPVAYDATGTEHLIPESELPVELPRDVAFSPTGQSPLASATSWRSYKGLTREADTLDTFVCSSWYYLRYPSPRYAAAAFDPEQVKRWLPVDTYVGGAEHAVLHLLYARFITKVLFDAGLISFEEPFLRLHNQGSILGPDHQKMSKSKGNVINPDEVIAEMGADSFRCYELFMAPFEVEKPWSTTGIVGVRRFIEKVWKLQDALTNDAPRDKEQQVIHRAISRITDDIAAFAFNTCISTLMETVNALMEQEKVSREGYLTLVRLLSPFAPHVAEELWEALGQDGFCSLAAWPQADPRYLVSATWECPVQVNGKVRAKLTLPSDASEDVVLAAVQSDPTVQQYLKGKVVHKTVVVPGRLVSLVTD